MSPGLKTLNGKAIINTALFTLLMFPFVKIIPANFLATDTQIHTLIIPFFVILFNRNTSIPKQYYWLFIPFAIATAFLIIEPLDFTLTIKKWIQYPSLLLISVAAYMLLRNDKGKILNANYFLIIVLIYFFAALLQQFLGKEILSFLLSSSGVRGGLNRGVTSLTNEPSFFGIISFLFFLIFNCLNLKHKRLVSVLCIFQTLFLAKSTLGACSFIVYYFLDFLNNFKLKKAAFYVLTLIAIIVSFNLFLQNSRIYKIVTLLIERPHILLSDRSIRERTDSFLIGIKGSADNYFLPNGFTKWKYYSTEYNVLASNSTLRATKRGQSRLGNTIFELGIFSIIVFYFFYKCFSFCSPSIITNSIYTLSFMTILFQGTPFATSTLGCTLSFVYYHAKQKQNSKQNKSRQIKT